MHDTQTAFQKMQYHDKKSFWERINEEGPPSLRQIKFMNFFRYFVLLFSLIALSVFTTAAFQRLFLNNSNGFTERVKNAFVAAFTMEEVPDSPITPVGMLILLLGLFFYVLKKKQQFYYGLLETLFALANCRAISIFIKSSLLKEPNKFYALIIALMTTLYLLTRGFSNVREGYDKPFYLKDKLWILDLFFLRYPEFGNKHGDRFRQKPAAKAAITRHTGNAKRRRT